MLKFKTQALVVFAGIFLFYSGTLALADYRRDDRVEVRGNVNEHRVIVDRHERHYYRNGRWYRHGWFGWEVSVPVLSTGVYVDSLPPAYTPVVVQGATYYYGNNTYFRALPDGGYTVVSISS